MTAVLRSGTAPFVPRARLLKLLGGELIRDEVMAITELVKNAHDADASRVRLEFMDVTSSGGVIVVEDDGLGMDLEILLDNWMQPAGSSKLRKEGRFTPGGRRVLGEKGVGRFAVDRIGRQVELVSRRPASSSEIVARFDWDAFDDEMRLLSDVHAVWSERAATSLRGNGTVLRVSELRTSWSERMFRRLCTRLQRLLSPHHDPATFSIEIESNEFPDYSGTLKADYLDRAPYKHESFFDGDQTIRTSFNGGTPIEQVWNGAGELTCGPVRITVHAFDLESDSVARVGPPMEVRPWLRQWSGISIYRDGFRVLPYGEPDDDWLRLDQRRVNNPVVRLSNNQVCGFVEISRDLNADLRDQTNRGGLLQNRAYDDLRRLVLFVLQLLETERQLIRNPPDRADDPGVSTLTSGSAESELIKQMKETASTLGGRKGTRLGALVSRLERNLQESRAGVEAELSMYADLAALGQSAAFLHHALRPQLNGLRSELRELQLEASATESPISEVRFWSIDNRLEEIEEYVNILAKVAPSVKRRRRTIDVSGELEGFEQSVTHLLAEHGIHLEVKTPKNEVLRADLPPESLQNVLHILLWNSLEWLGGRDGARIRIVARRQGDLCEILFQDNGPGIAPEHAESVFEPGFSLKERGRGTGLAIARHLLSGSLGWIETIIDGRRKGACLRIVLRAKRSRST